MLEGAEDACGANGVVWMPVEVLWLSKHEFRAQGNGFKRDYGGPVQLSNWIRAGVYLQSGWLLGYQYEHMSNGHVYEPTHHWTVTTPHRLQILDFHQVFLAVFDVQGTRSMGRPVRPFTTRLSAPDTPCRRGVDPVGSVGSAVKCQQPCR